jgi:hypothetical protein
MSTTARIVRPGASFTTAQTTAGGNAVAALTAGGVLLDAGGVTISTGLPSGLTYSSNILQQSNGTNAQRYRIFNTGNTTNGEWFDIDWQTTANVATIGALAAGTGTLRPVTAVGAWTFPAGLMVGANGEILAASGYLNLAVGINWGLTIQGDRITIPNATRLTFSNGSNNSGSTVPGLKRNGSVLEVINGNDTGYANLECRSIIENPPASVTLAVNGELSYEQTSNTAGNFVYRGSDGVTRRCALVFV